jgi:hypothetical protein
VADYLSIFAFVVSLASLYLSVETRLRDRYKLRCNAFLIYNVGEEETYQLSVTVTNEGRRPVSIVQIYYEEDESAEYPICSPIHGGAPDDIHPIELAENQTKQFTSPVISKKKMLETTKQLYVCVVDSRGKTYRISIDNEAFDV